MLQLTHSLLGLLPLVVVGAVAWGATGLLLAANVEPQVVWAIVGLVAVHVVHQLIAQQWAPKMHRHRKAMRENGLTAALHRSVETEMLGQDSVDLQERVSVPVHAFRRSFTFIQPAMFALAQRFEAARAAVAPEVCADHFFADFRHGAHAHFPALGARHIHDELHLPVKALKARCMADCWVQRQRLQVGQSRHC